MQCHHKVWRDVYGSPEEKIDEKIHLLNCSGKRVHFMKKHRKLDAFQSNQVDMHDQALLPRQEQIEGWSKL